MIVVDTNVISEAMKPEPHPTVLIWLNDQTAETLYLSSVTLAELLFGIAALPIGRRKDTLKKTLDGLMKLFNGRVLPFNAEAARYYAELTLKANIAGKGFPNPDSYIAAIAATHGFAVATRDISPFAAAGLVVINPLISNQENNE